APPRPHPQQRRRGDRRARHASAVPRLRSGARGPERRSQAVDRALRCRAAFGAAARGGAGIGCARWETIDDTKARDPMKLTPMLEQYFEIKRQVPDAILFYRLGDFYEMFFEDAEKDAPILDLVLTARGKGQENEAPMCGVPYHAADGYIAKLIKLGFRVALCDQVEDPADSKGLVRREVVRVVTPGTATESFIVERESCYLLSLVPNGQS